MSNGRSTTSFLQLHTLNKTMASSLRSLIYSNEGGNTPKLSVLDQLLIPHEKVYLDVPDVETAWSVIREMQIRGAPLIAIVALLGLSVDLHANPNTLRELDELKDGAVLKYIQDKMAYLNTSRPTAVNLSNALQELEVALQKATKDRESLRKAVLEYSEFMLERDVSDNKAIGNFGADAILAKTGKDKVDCLTICNTGSLATAGYGTALGVVRSLQGMGKLNSITALETRPYNQGSRLTSFEIVEEKMNGGQLICDSAAGALMKVRFFLLLIIDRTRLLQYMSWPTFYFLYTIRQKMWMLSLSAQIVFAPMEILRIKLVPIIYR
jgi:eIF-2B alpha/beta/delta-like uncharacterized protein